MKLTVVFGALCLFAAAHYVVAATASTYVGVKAGDSMQFTATTAGTMYVNPWPGTYDVTVFVDNVTDNGGNATIGTHSLLSNATYTKPEYWSFVIKETDINTTTAGIAYFVINKNISNKTLSIKTDDGAGNLQWVNASWDANGVLEKSSYLMISSWVVTLYTTYARKGGIPGYPAMLVLAFTVVAVGLLARKKLHVNGLI